MGTNSLTTDITSSGQAEAFGRKSRERYVYKASGAALLVMGALLLTGAREPGAAIAAPALAPTPVAAAPVVYHSRLEQIAAEQGDAPVPAPAPAVAVVEAAPEVAPPPTRPVRSQEPAAVQLANAPLPSRNGKIQPAVLRTWTAPLSGVALPAAAPNVFGSVAISTGHTPIDAKWRSVSHSRPSPGVAADVLAKVRGESAYQQVETVNLWVNRHLNFVPDTVGGGFDEWANADESLRRGAGDCEDYAIAKLQILRAAGFDERDLYLVVVRDLVQRADHAILVARVDGRLVVLDSNNDRIIAADAVRDYKPLLSFSGDRAWIHGYRQEPQVQYASNSGPVPQPGEGPGN